MRNLFDDIANEIAPKKINVTYNQLEENNSLEVFKRCKLITKRCKWNILANYNMWGYERVYGG